VTTETRRPNLETRLADNPVGVLTISDALPSLTQAVDQTRARHVAAVTAGDADGAAALFAPDAVLLPPGQPAVHERVAIRAWFTHLFAHFRVQSFTLQPGAVDGRGDIAIEHGVWNASFSPRDGSSELRGSGTYLTIYGRLADGSVRMAYDTFNGMPG
jgi:uncharacterized protein (TIGR02246 family)